MPKALHDALVRGAEKKRLTGKRKAAYVYGTLDAIEKKLAKKR